MVSCTIPPSLAEPIQQACLLLSQVKREMGKRIIGQQGLIEALLIGLLSGGHVLLEGAPGVAKTLAASTLSRVVNCTFKRIQFTPDLLPADLLGGPVYNPKEGSFSIRKGPIFTQFLLTDELNRAPAKVQSALLEGMEERQVTLGGETFSLSPLFFVVATQNPLEQEGTYPLAEAQSDRFMMKVVVPYPSAEEERALLSQMHSPSPALSPILEPSHLLDLRQLITHIYLDEHIADYVLRLVQATRPPHLHAPALQGLIDYGASPRATLALTHGAKVRALLAGRAFVLPQDVKVMAPLILRHRLRLSYTAEGQRMTPDDLITLLIKTLPVP